MKSDLNKAKETLEKQGVKIDFKVLDSESSEFMAEHIKTLFKTLPSDKRPDIQYFTMDGKQTTKASLRNNGIMDFKIKHIPSGESATYKDCCPIFEKPYGEVRIPITKEREKINMKNFDAWYAYDLSHGTQQMDPEMASYFQGKGIKTPDITATHITQMREDLSRPWHETTDGRAQLVSRESHQRFRHSGGVSDAKFNVEMASRAEKLSSVDSSYLKSSFDKSPSSRTGKLFGGIGAAGAASGSNVNWGKIITSIIAVLVVLALIVGVVVLLAKILPPVFEAIGQFFVNLWNGICNFFGAIGRFFVNLWNGICDFFVGIFNGFEKVEMKFETDDDGKTYYVSECRDTFWAFSKENLEVVIPDTYKGSPVVGIAKKSCDITCKSLYIPSTIEWIEEDAFKYSSNIEQLHIDSLEAWINIDFGNYESHPFSGTFDNITPTIYLNGEILTNLVIPDSINKINPYTFYHCSNIETVTFTDTLVSIGRESFAYCSSIESIVIPNSVEVIGLDAFEGCNGLNAITVPFIGDRKENPKTTRFDYIFGSLPESLKCVTITSGKIIGYDAFARNNYIETIVLPEGIEIIAEGAFFDCYALKNINIPESVTTIEQYAFRNSGIETITIPKNVTVIGNRAFQNSALKRAKFVVPNGWHLKYTPGYYHIDRWDFDFSNDVQAAEQLLSYLTGRGCDGNIYRD